MNISRRDYFAGLAMQALVGAVLNNQIREKNDADISKAAYDLADEMIKSKYDIKVPFEKGYEYQ